MGDYAMLMLIPKTIEEKPARLIGPLRALPMKIRGMLVRKTARITDLDAVPVRALPAVGL